MPRPGGSTSPRPTCAGPRSRSTWRAPVRATSSRWVPWRAPGATPTALSYDGRFDIGLFIDPVAIDAPADFRDAVESSFADLSVRPGPVRPPAACDDVRRHRHDLSRSARRHHRRPGRDGDARATPPRCARTDRDAGMVVAAGRCAPRRAGHRFPARLRVGSSGRARFADRRRWSRPRSACSNPA